VVAPPRKGESALEQLRREQDAVDEANIIICAARQDWERMRAGLAKQEMPEQPACVE
jgi:hypothetical protein